MGAFLFSHVWVTNVTLTVYLGVAQVCPKVGVTWMCSPINENLSYLCLGATSSLFQRHLNSRILKHGFQLPKITGIESNFTLCRCLCWYFAFTSSKYLKNETHLQNAQVNKVSSVNKGIVKTCLIVDMVRKDWSWIVVSACELHYFVLAGFGSFGVAASFSTTMVEPKDLCIFFFTGMKRQNMVRIVKKQNHFILSTLVTQICQMCFTSTIAYGVIVDAPLFNL